MWIIGGPAHIQNVTKLIPKRSASNNVELSFGLVMDTNVANIEKYQSLNRTIEHTLSQFIIMLGKQLLYNILGNR